MSGWTQERRQRQAELIQSWKPWEKSTGPKTIEGKCRVARNAWKGGHREAIRRIARLVNSEVASAKKRLMLV